jgi:hypothetical protein
MIEKCVYPDCIVVPRKGHLMCKPHWFSLPSRIRTRLTIAYENGGEGSSIYTRALAEMIRHLKGERRGTSKP